MGVHIDAFLAQRRVSLAIVGAVADERRHGRMQTVRYYLDRLASEGCAREDVERAMRTMRALGVVVVDETTALARLCDQPPTIPCRPGVETTLTARRCPGRWRAPMAPMPRVPSSDWPAIAPAGRSMRYT